MMFWFFRSYKKQMEKAENHLDKGELDKSQRIYEKVIKKLTKNKTSEELDELNDDEIEYLGQSYFQRGWIFRNQKKPDLVSAMAEYEKAEKYIELDDDAISFMATEYAKAKSNSELAISKYFEFMKRYAGRSLSNQETKVINFVKGLCNISWQNENSKKCEDKMSLCNEIISNADPKLDWAYMNLGYGFLQKKELAKSVSQFNKALEISPGSNLAKHYIAFVNGLISLKDGNTDLAIERLRNAVFTIVPFRKAIPENEQSENLDISNEKNGEAYFLLGKILLDRYKKNKENKRIISQTQGSYDLLDSITNLEIATEINPNNADYVANLGIACAENNNHERAKCAFQRSIELKPDQKEILYRLGMELKLLKQFDSAINMANGALSIDSSFSDAHCLIGEIQLEQGKYNNAKLSFEKADTFNGDKVRINIGLAKAYLALKDYKTIISKLSPIAGTDPNIKFYLARAYILSNRYLDAIRLLESIRSLGNWETLYYLGCSYICSGRYRDALKAFNEIISWNKYLGSVYLQRGNAKMRLNDKDGAQHDYEIAIKLSSECFEARYAIGICLIDKDNERAIFEFQQALTKSPEYGPVHLALAFLYEKNGVTEKAIEHYKKAIKFRTNIRESNAHLGILLSKSERYAESIEYMEKATDLGDKSPKLLYYLGFSLAKLNRYEEAIKYWNTCLQSGLANNINSGNILKNIAELKYQVAMQYERDGNLRDAIKYWEEYLNIHNNDEKIRKKIAQLYWILARNELKNRQSANFIAAKSDIEKAIEKDNNEWTYKYYMCICYYIERNYENCLSTLNELQNLNGTDIKIKILKGLALIQTGQLKSGLSELESLQTDDNNLNDTINRAIADIYVRKGDWVKAADRLIPLIKV